jgi:hypothetical protein
LRSPKIERFHPPKEWKASGTGIGTLTPIIPALASDEKARAESPSRVKIAAPLPYSWSFTSFTALS